MLGVNQVNLLGNLGADVEVRHTHQGTPVANFRLATTRSFKQDGNKKEETEWHRIVVWGKLGELCGEYLSKGRQAFVTGRLQTRSWEDRNGVKRYTTEIVADEVTFVGSGRQQDLTVKAKSEEVPSADLNEEVALLGLANIDDDDVPF